MEIGRRHRISELRRCARASCIALVPLLLVGCLKRVQDVIVVHPDGACVITLTSVFDLDSILSASPPHTPGEMTPSMLTERGLRLLAERCRTTMRADGGVEVLEVNYTQDLVARELTQALKVRTPSLAEWLRSSTARNRCRSPMRVRAAVLEQEADRTWLLKLDLVVGGWARGAEHERLVETGPPLHLLPVPTRMTLTLPGRVIEADPEAHVEGRSVSWLHQAEAGWKAASHEVWVHFEGPSTLREFSLRRDGRDRQYGSWSADTLARVRQLGPLDGEPVDSATGRPLSPTGQVKESARPGTVRVTGRVLQDGKPRGNVAVGFYLANADGSYGGFLGVATTADGTFEIPGLWPGTYGVQVDVEGCEVWLGEAVVEDVTSFRYDVNLGSRALRVHVVDAEGDPVQGADVWMRRRDSVSVQITGPKTDSQGWVTIPHLGPGAFTLSACANQAVALPRSVVLDDVNVDEPIQLRLKPGYSKVLVRVRDASGTLVRSSIRCQHVEGVPMETLNTDRDGGCVLYLSPGEWMVGLSSGRPAELLDHRYEYYAQRVGTRAGTTSLVELVRQ